jgi:hypothetical protein
LKAQAVDGAVGRLKMRVRSQLFSEVQGPVIKIRYADLPGGLHARAETRGKNTIIYLLPGLTVPQRRSALRRLRGNARMGRGPRLSGSGIARARAADRMRTNVRNAAAALRVHPAILAPPLVVTVLAAVAFVLLVPLPVNLNPSQVSSPGTVGPPAGAPVPGTRGGGQRFNPGGSGHATMPPDRLRSTMKLAPHPRPDTPAPARTTSPSARPAPSQTPKHTPSPTPSQTSSPSPSGSGSSSGATPSPSPSSGGSGAGSQGNCVLVLLGICL